MPPPNTAGIMIAHSVPKRVSQMLTERDRYRGSTFVYPASLLITVLDSPPFSLTTDFIKFCYHHSHIIAFVTDDRVPSFC